MFGPIAHLGRYSMHQPLIAGVSQLRSFALLESGVSLSLARSPARPVARGAS